MTNTPLTGRTIHIHRHQWHLAWDHSIPPVARVQSGEEVSFDLLDASCGQIVEGSTENTQKWRNYGTTGLCDWT
ncbi:MAG: hypothetical protein E6J04_08455 [Chloroflexi bacterium]|nr:MAG: hypothetical protein E6J04_08455 [Chloroflexota bacterium]